MGLVPSRHSGWPGGRGLSRSSVGPVSLGSGRGLVGCVGGVIRCWGHRQGVKGRRQGIGGEAGCWALGVGGVIRCWGRRQGVKRRRQGVGGGGGRGEDVGGWGQEGIRGRRDGGPG